jgi:hypothetical protein
MKLPASKTPGHPDKRRTACFTPGPRRRGNGEQAEDEMDFTLMDEQRRLQQQASDFATRR